ncbi:hypothetical protein BDV93DRAFT_514626 [Ceratobasidium sp. AG-I]|nr:hypothetical protein BDV93DRAFT_514626 [Ceratobasidium sp. AG-I]
MVASAALNIPNTHPLTPGHGDTVIYGPIKFADDSPALKEAGFNRIDAILPIPGQERMAYFFAGSQYATIHFWPENPKQDTLIGTNTIADGWASLKRAGFTHVDAALMAPYSKKEVFFFSGDKYCRIQLAEGENDDDVLLEGPINIATGWNPMGFRSVDVIIPRPGGPGNYEYVFSGSDYIQTKVTEFGEGELFSNPRNVASAWSESLGKAGFY